HCDPSSHVPASFSPPIAILPLANEKAQLSLDFFDRLMPASPAGACGHAPGKILTFKDMNDNLREGE
ncbi:hypothetical protein, partial [Intestinimonas butyriciproducens]|uniref:hypothetical protein n=1 Tax=Intestinimonas butyriciproducens TaxID=1297617 RepID=UPI00195D8A29